MSIVLTCLVNFQEYILLNIEQLIKLNHKNIYVITEIDFFNKFEKYSKHIYLINKNDFNHSFNYGSNSNLDKNFRNGFWQLTSFRFFYIYEFMKKYNIKDVIHIENDVLLYYNIETILNNFDKKYFYIPFDSFDRNIASIIYIPDFNVFKTILDNYDNNLNDMYNFKNIKDKTGLIQNFPIFPNIYCSSEEEEFVSDNYDKFNMIFDAAAIGQYLGGIDPRNDSSNTVGFVNETCVIKYNNYLFEWNTIENIKRPFIIIKNKKYLIFNLHIHSKNLHLYV